MEQLLVLVLEPTPDPGTGLIAAPTPSQDSADVISVYSDAVHEYCDRAGSFLGPTNRRD